MFYRIFSRSRRASRGASVYIGGKSKGGLFLNRRNIRHLIGFALLIGLDQAVKLYIWERHPRAGTDLLGTLVFFKPVQNTHFSWLNSWLDLGVGFWPHLVLKLIAVVMIFYIYRYWRSKRKKEAALYLSYLLCLSGALCSLIDQLFWGGSLDFIGIRSLFVFDLKDVYLAVGEAILCALFIALVLRNPSLLRFDPGRDRLILRDFFGFVAADLRRLTRSRGSKDSYDEEPQDKNKDDDRNTD